MKEKMKIHQNVYTGHRKATRCPCRRIQRAVRVIDSNLTAKRKRILARHPERTNERNSA